MSVDTNKPYGFIRVTDKTAEHEENLKALGYVTERRTVHHPKNGDEEFIYVQLSGFAEGDVDAFAQTTTRNKNGDKVVKTRQVRAFDFSSDEKFEAAVEALVENKQGLRYTDTFVTKDDLVEHNDEERPLAGSWQTAANMMDVLSCLIMNSPYKEEKAKEASERAKKMSALRDRLSRDS